MFENIPKVMICVDRQDMMGYGLIKGVGLKDGSGLYARWDMEVQGI